MVLTCIVESHVTRVGIGYSDNHGGEGQSEELHVDDVVWD